jgi:hypothetical protein
MANVTTTTAAAILPEIWEAEVEFAAHNHRGFSGRIMEFQFTGPGDVLHIPKIGAISAAAFSGTVSYTANTETSVDITPDVSYAAVQIDRKADVRAVTSLGNVYQVELGQSLAQYEDEQIAGLYAGLSHSVGGSSDFSEANYLLAIRNLVQYGKNKVMMGMTPIWGVFHPAQWDHVLVVSNINSALVRGELNGPAKTGSIDLAYGVNISFSSSVQVSTTARNMIYTSRAFAIARKQTPTIDVEFDADTLSTKIVASQDFGVAEMNDELGVEYQTNAS